MIDLLTTAATIVEIAALGLAIAGFASHVWNRVTATTARPIAVEPVTPAYKSIDEEEAEEAMQPHWADALPSELPDVWESIDEESIVATPTPLIPSVPFLLCLPPARESLPTTVRELRKLALDRGIKGAGRWPKSKLLEVLAA